MEAPEYFPILNITRSCFVDNYFYAIAYLYGDDGLIKAYTPINDAKFYLRSLFKPIQASILTDDIINHFSFTEKELAVMQASHAGENIHTELVQSILSKIGLSEKDLLCPIIPPLNTKIYKNQNFSNLHNNCSGKHALMLAACVFKGYDISNYNDFSHPIQIEIKEKLLSYAKTNDCIETKDGCTLPVYGLSAKEIMRAFLNYYSDIKNSKLINAYKNNPYIIGGKDDFGLRTDTKIMQLSNNLISKVGAGGLIYVYNIEKRQILFVKMAQNNNAPREIITLELLYRLKWLKDRFYDDNIYIENGDIIGKYCLNVS